MNSALLLSTRISIAAGLSRKFRPHMLSGLIGSYDWMLSDSTAW
jgi:hypothetical protein